MITGFLSYHKIEHEAIPTLSKLLTGRTIISNRKVGPPHQIIRFGNSSVYGTDDIILDPKNYDYNLEDEFTKNIILANELINRVDQLLYAVPSLSQLSPLVLLILLQTNKPIRVVMKNQLFDNAQLANMLQSVDMNQLKEQYERIFGKKKQTVVYNESELIKTPSGATLRPYQQQMVDFVLEKHRVGLFVDMGLGKTLATLAVLNELSNAGKIDKTKPILVVAPITVALDTWSREAEKWGYDMDVKINIQLPVKKRNALLSTLLEPQERLTLLTTNPEQLPQIFTFFQEHGIFNPFETVIVDELSLFKSATSKRFDVLSHNTSKSKYFIGLTGTPSPNGLLDVWSQLIAIDPKNRRLFGSNFYEYRDRYFAPDKVHPITGQVFSYAPRQGVKQEIYNMMSQSVISMQSEGLIDLPDIVYTNAYVTLPKKAMKTYKELEAITEDEMKLFEMELDQSNVKLANSAVKKGKLAQLANGAIYESTDLVDFTDESGESLFTTSRPYTVFHDEKLKKLKELVETATSPLLVFVVFRSDLDRLGKYIDYELLDPKSSSFSNTIKRWNNGEIPVMVVNPASVSHGLNIQEGGHTAIWLSTPWNNEQYRQANKRLHRSGQTHTVSIVHIVARGTVDEEVIERVDMKESNQQDLMESLQASKVVVNHD